MNTLVNTTLNETVDETVTPTRPTRTNSRRSTVETPGTPMRDNSREVETEVTEVTLPRTRSIHDNEKLLGQLRDFPNLVTVEQADRAK